MKVKRMKVIQLPIKLQKQTNENESVFVCEKKRLNIINCNAPFRGLCKNTLVLNIYFLTCKIIIIEQILQVKIS
jgi:hypothetical protein